MELNEYLYANGEVMKLWMYPRGPDSGFLVYPGVGGNRFTYFGTTRDHACAERAVLHRRAASPGRELIPNGLPQYTLYYENDDDGWRKLGTDSRVAFTAPADGDYLVRVSDVRGMGGDDLQVRADVRPPRPDFEVKMDGQGPHDQRRQRQGVHGHGDAQRRIRRRDRYSSFAKLPPGFHVTTPLVIQAGQTFAHGTITADADAPR